MVDVKVTPLTNGSVAVEMWPCLLIDQTIEDTHYPVWDVGIVLDGGTTVHPIGVTNIHNITGPGGSLKICFSKIELISLVTSVVLIKRDSNYKEVSANTQGELGIVWASGALFCFGGVLVLFFHSFLPFNVAVFMAAMQGVVLLLFRGVYFFVLAAGDIKIGGLLDFALIEIPTFIYIGIFLRIILVGYWVFFKYNEMSRVSLFLAVSIAFLLNWLVFAAIMIAAALSNNTSSISKSCNCQISGPVQQSDNAQIIRLTYKSFVFVVAVCVFLLTFLYGKTLVKGRNPQVYYQVVGLSLGLLFDCLAFLVYYAVDTPSAYFLIALWFTELLPIVAVNGMVAGSQMGFWFSEQMRTRSTSRLSVDSSMAKREIYS